MVETSSQLLIVDDDPELLRLLVEEMSHAGHQCTGCDNARDALVLLRTECFDLVVLDWTLPDFTGVELCRRLRRSANTTPVLMLTARDDVDEQVQALDAGVDDYLTKPFDLKELHARVRAQLRRRQYDTEERPAEQLTLGDLKINLLSRSVHRGERALSLSQREFELLCYLVRDPGTVHSRQAILEGVWGTPFVGDPNTLDVYLGYLRKKVERPGEAQLLHTVRGVGVTARVGDPKP